MTKAQSQEQRKDKPEQGIVRDNKGPEQPAGLVHIACAGKGKPTTHRVMLYGDVGRAEVRIRALETALGMLMDQMLTSPSAHAA